MSSGVTGPRRADDSASRRAYDRDMEQPHVVVLFGATGDLARRKLLPGLLHLFEAGLLRDCRIVGTSLDDLDTEQFVKFAREGIDEFSRPFDESLLGRLRRAAVVRPAERRPAGAGRRRRRGREAARDGVRRRDQPAALPQRAAEGRAARRAPARRGRAGRAVPDHHGEAVRHRPGVREEAQRAAARGLRRGADLPHRPLPRQGGGAEHPGVPLRQRSVRADLEPQLHRPRPDRRPRDARPGDAGRVLRVAPAPSATWSSPT